MITLLQIRFNVVEVYFECICKVEAFVIDSEEAWKLSYLVYRETDVPRLNFASFLMIFSYEAYSFLPGILTDMEKSIDLITTFSKGMIKVLRGKNKSF